MHHVYGLIPIDVRGIYLTYFTMLFLKDVYKMENTCVCLNIIKIELHFRSLFYHDSIIKTFCQGEQSTSHVLARTFIPKKKNESLFTQL